MSDHEHHDEHPSCGCPQSPTGHATATWDRRAFLRRGIAGALGLAIGAPLLGVLGRDGANGVSALYANTDGQMLGAMAPKIKSVIVLWMDGGPSQFETFDPKPSHINGGPTRSIGTAIRGAEISANLPRVAEVLDRAAVIRCMSTREGSHSRARQLMRTGYTPNPTVHFPGLGAIVAHEIGDWSASLPQNVSINGPGHTAGELGVRFDPFFVRNPSRPVDNMSTARGVTAQRIDRRLEFLSARESAFRARQGGDASSPGAHVEMMRGAVSLMRAESAQAFDISGEEAHVRATYGDSRFGQGCLMARRLVEAGVRFVEVSHGGWDTHMDNFNRSTQLCEPLDQGMSALILDLEARGLLDSTLVLWMGEFGRTPRINGNEGRDHYPQAWSVVAAGGGIRAGQVIGQTSNDGTQIVGQSIATADLFRTIMLAAGIDPNVEYYAGRGRPVKYADGGRVVSALVKG